MASAQSCPNIRLGDVVEFRTGKLDSNQAVDTGSYPFFTCSPETLRIDRYSFDTEAVILAGNNANGIFSVKYYKGKFDAYQRTYIITPLDLRRLDCKYLYYQVKILARQLTEYSIGTATRFLTLRILNNLEIPLPPIEEQQAIARILGVLDDKIELNRRMNRTLEEMARAIFKSWFVDFDPVTAKSEGRQPNGMNAETAALFPSSFQDSELGPIPKGWQIGSLLGISAVIMGSSPPGDTYNEEGNGVPLINGPVEFGNYFAVKRKWTTAPTRLSTPNDLIFCVRGSTTGRRVIADDVYCLGRGVCAIRSLTDNQPFVNETIESSLDRLLAKTSGSVFPNLNSSDISEFEILVPPEELIEAFCRAAKPLAKKAWENIKESETLASIRDALLPRLLSGEIRVKSQESKL